MPVSIQRLSAVVLLSSSVTFIALGDPQPARPDQALLAVSWVQHAAERDALCRQTFNTARAMLGLGRADTSWTAALEQSGQPDLGRLPDAIIVDVDETVLDNSPYTAWLVQRGLTYDPASWRRWVEERQAAPIPGAVEFLTHVAEQGITVFYVTNRAADEEAATRDNLRALGFPLLDTEDLDVVLTKGEHDGWTSEKRTRREAIAATHRILMMIGDDLGDFVAGVKPDRAVTAAVDDVESVRRHGASLEADRAARVAGFSGWWGKRWLVLPNPLYGSWLSVLEARTGHVFGDGDAPRRKIRGVIAEALETRETRTPREPAKDG